MLENPLLRDRDVEFILYELNQVERLTRLPAFADHSRETFDLFLQSARRLARTELYPAYRKMDAEPPRLVDGRVHVHPEMKRLWPRLVELGLLTATRPAEVGGLQLPLSVAVMGQAYLMAANLSAYGYVGLTTGAAHLLEEFGDDFCKRELMTRMYRGEWTGTMALTEPQAGSSLSDVKTRATPLGGRLYSLRGSKIFISAGDHDFAPNVVHLALARIDDAPPGIKGVSLFAVPRVRPDGTPNDVQVAGLIHKIGWRGLPSLAIELGTDGNCHGWLVGEEHRGIGYMFQMMNEARIMVGMNGVATASVAYHEALAYAESRPQGRPLTSRDPRAPQVPIIEHADVRRMLLRQKAIVEGGLALLCWTALQADLAAHAESAEAGERASLLLDLLTPVAKSFPAERGFEANALALQVHGGYGYSSEYLPEAWLRDQKLNSIHEGTTTIQGMDLLGRKVVAGGGAALRLLAEEIRATPGAAALEPALAAVEDLTTHLGTLGLAGDVEGMMRHSADYLELFSILVVSWQWLRMAAVAERALAAGASDVSFYEGKRAAARYWLATEAPRVAQLAQLCKTGEDSYARIRPEHF
jgi:butyryl-CoA dehydrogenase